MNWPRKPNHVQVLYESCQTLAPYAYPTHTRCVTFKEDGEEATEVYGRFLGYL